MCCVINMSFNILSETPCVGPHAGCCGLEPLGYPIMLDSTTEFHHLLIE